MERGAGNVCKELTDYTSYNTHNTLRLSCPAQLETKYKCHINATIHSPHQSWNVDVEKEKKKIVRITEY